MGLSSLAAMFRRSTGLTRNRRRTRRNLSQYLSQSASIAVEACEPRLVLSVTIPQLPPAANTNPAELSLPEQPDDHVNFPGPDATDLTLNPITSTVTLSGTIHDINDVDVFQYAVPAGMEIRFDVGPPGPTGFTGLPSLMATDSPVGPPLITLTGPDVRLGEGLWYLSVSGDPSFLNGDYSINLSVTAASLDDHVDIWGPEATTIPPGPIGAPLMFGGQLGNINDQDFFQFHLDEASLLTLQWTTPDGAPRGQATLFDAFGRAQFGDGPESPGDSSVYPLSAGQWWLSISGNPSFQSGAYSLIGTLDDYPNTPSQVLTPNLEIPESYMNIMVRPDTADDVDVLRFDVTQPSDLHLLSPDGILTEVTDSSGKTVTLAGDKARLSVGTYFISTKPTPDFVVGASLGIRSALIPVHAPPVQVIGGIGRSIDSTPGISWMPVDGAASYDLFIGVSGESKPVYRKQGITNTTFEVPMELEDGDYTVWVKAKLNGDRQSLWGNGFALTIGATPQLTGPSAQSGQVAWQPIVGAQRYEVWLGTVDPNTGARKHVLSASTTETSWEIPQSVSGGHFGVWVRAVGTAANGTVRKSQWNEGQVFTLEDPVAAPVIKDWTVSTLVNPPFDSFAYALETGVALPTSPLVIVSFNGVPNFFGPWPIASHGSFPDEISIQSDLSLLPPFNLGTQHDFRFIDVNSGAVLYQSPAISFWGITSTFLVMDPASAELLEGHDYAVQTRISSWQNFRFFDFAEPVTHRASDWSTAFPISLGTSLSRPNSTASTSSGRPVLSWPIATNRIVWAPVAIPSFPAETGDLTELESWQNFKQHNPQYEVRIESAVSGLAVLATSKVTTNQFAVPDSLQPGGYTARVRAVYDDGTVGTWSSAYAFKIASEPVVITSSTAPTVDATPGITWKPVADASTYEVWIGLKGSKTPTYQMKGLESTQHRVATALNPGTYDVWVRAQLRNGGVTKWGTPKTLQIGLPPVVTLQGNTLSWQAVNGATRYEVWANQVDDHGKLIAARVITNDNVLTTSTTLPVQPGRKFRVWIRAIRNEAGETYHSNWSKALEI